MAITKIQPNKPTVRQTFALDHHEPVVVELHPRSLVLRTAADTLEVQYSRILAIARSVESKRRYATSRL